MSELQPSLSSLVVAPLRLDDLLARAQEAESRLIARSRVLVELESPTSVKAAVDRTIACFADWCREAGGTVRIHENSRGGNSLEARFGPESSAQKPVLLLGHLDTVWNVGTLKKMPWREDSSVLAGPGVLDMKVGAAMALTAVEMLLRAHQLDRPILILLHGDEEVGSPWSRKLTEELAMGSAAVLVLEPAQGTSGALKTARKGVGLYKLEVSGVAAHAGVDFISGSSAILELARQLECVAAMTEPANGLTLNPGVIGGGTQSNVVADYAWAEIDVRACTEEDAARIDLRLSALKAFDPRNTLHVSGSFNRPPMVRSQATARLFLLAQDLARQIGLETLTEASTGGGSDGSLTAALGVPTLDGMGAVGAGAHAGHEHVLKRYLAPRTALLAAMMLSV